MLVEIVLFCQLVKILRNIFATDIFFCCWGSVLKGAGGDLEGTGGVMGYHATVNTGARPCSTESGCRL